MGVLCVLLCACGWPVTALAQESAQGTILEGVVLDEMRAPIEGARVTLGAGVALVAETRTGADGKFVFSNLLAREAVLRVEAAGFERIERRWLASASPETRLEIMLRPAALAEEVTVTATRTAARVDETAASVSVINEAQLETTAATRLDDALRQVAGFSLFRRSGSRTANPTTQGVSLRGVGASGASRALVLFDGVPLNDPFGGWVYWGRAPRSGISRVEILRGGASHLYGSGALGGVVNILSREPMANALSLEASYGNQQTADGNLFASFKREQWAGSLSAEVFSTDGFRLVARPERGPVDIPAGARSTTFDLSLERRLARDGRLFVRGAVFGEARANGTPLQTNRTHIRQLSAGADFELERIGSFVLRTYGGTEVFDQTFTAVAADRNSEALTRLQRVPSQFVGLSAQWSRVALRDHTLVAGVEAREVRGASDEIAIALGRPTALVGAGGRERTLGLFIEDIFRVTPRLLLTGGVRVDRWREFDAFSGTRPLTASAVAVVRVLADRSETALSPHLSVLYRPVEHLALSASFSRAFRQPTLNELYRSFRVGDVLTLANENLRAERLTGGEAAAAFDLYGGRLVTRSTFFWTELTRPVANVTLQVTPSLITRQRQNLGRTRSRGLELEAEARLGDRLTLTGGYLFVVATVVEFPANRLLEGLWVPQVARHQFTFQARYAKPERYSLGLQGRAAGNQFDDDQNRFPLGGFFTLDGFASRRVLDGLEVFAAAENLTGVRYTVGRTPVTTTGLPLLFRFGFRLQLGGR